MDRLPSDVLLSILQTLINNSVDINDKIFNVQRILTLFRANKKINKILNNEKFWIYNYQKDISLTLPQNRIYRIYLDILKLINESKEPIIKCAELDYEQALLKLTKDDLYYPRIFTTAACHDSLNIIKLMIETENKIIDLDFLLSIAIANKKFKVARYLYNLGIRTKYSLSDKTIKELSKQLCQGKTKDGQPCKRLVNNKYCKTHEIKS